jgi:hypothetical protein
MIESAHELEITPEVHSEAIKHMIATGGENGSRAVGELKSRIHEVRATMEREAVRHADPRGGGPGLPRVMFQMLRHANIRRAYQSRLDEMKSQGADVGAETAAGPSEGATAVEEVHAYLLKYAGQGYLEDLRTRTAHALVELKRELAEVVNELAIAHARHGAGQAPIGMGDPYRDHLPPNQRGSNHVSVHDSAYYRYTTLIARRNELAARIAAIEQDAEKRLETQAKLVSDVVRIAGGAKSVADCLRSASLLSGDHWKGDPASSDLVSLEKRRDRAAASLRALGPDAVGPAAESFRREAVEATEAADKLRAEIDRRRREEFGRLVAAATKGDEGARARIAAVARAQPVAFADEFGPRLEGAQFEKSALGQGVLALLDPDDRPERSVFT